MRRFTVLSLMAAVALVALGLAAMRDGSELAEMVSVWVLFLSLATGIVGSIVSRSPGWVGFVAFAGLYTGTAFIFVEESKGTTFGAFHNPFSLRAKFGLEPYLDEGLRRLYEVPPEPVELPFRAQKRRNGAVAKVQESVTPGTTFRVFSPVALTTEERKLYDQYVQDFQVRDSRLQQVSGNIERAKEIAQVLITLLLGLMGAVVGRLLAASNKITNSVATVPASSTSEEHAR